MKILVVDDSIIERKMVSDYFIKQGHEVDTAENGKIALEKIENEEPDLMTLDLLMPDMTGVDLLKILHEKKLSKTQIIVCSADIQETVKEECLGLGAKHFLNKPIKMEVLQKLIDDLFSSKE